MPDIKPKIIHDIATTKSASVFLMSFKFSTDDAFGKNFLRQSPIVVDIMPAVKNGIIE